MMRMDVDSVMFAKTMADETRQDMLKYLCCVWLSVNELVEQLGGKIGQPTVSHHLKKLEEAQLVIVRQEGRQRFYTLNQTHFTACCGKLMGTFAPDYGASFVPINTIR